MTADDDAEMEPGDGLRTVTGLAYLAPGLQLLFKSTAPRPQDQVDVEEAVAGLDGWSLALLDRQLPPEHTPGGH